MKGKLYWFVALIGGYALFLMSPIHATYAYFTDTKTIPMNLSLEMAESNASTVAGINITGNLELSFEKYTTPVTKTNTPMIELKTGDLGYFGDVLLNVKISSDKDGKLPIRDVEKYFTLSLPETVHFYGENKKQTQMQVTKNADFPDSYYKEGEFKFYVTITANIGETKTSSKTFAITDHNGKMTSDSPNTSWPEGNLFNDKHYYIAQDLYYGESNLNELTTITPALIYFQSPTKNDELQQQLINANFYTTNLGIDLVSEVQYIESKGYVVKLTIDSTKKYLYAEKTKSDQSDYVNSKNQISLIKSAFFSNYQQDLRIVHPLLLNADFAVGGTAGVKSDTTIYTRSSGVTVNYATQQDSGHSKQLITLSNLASEGIWRVSNTADFTITAQSDTSVTIKQNSSNGGKSATLQLVSKSDNKTVLFERQIVSVNEEATETLKNEYEVMTAISPNKIYPYLLKEVTGTSSITATARYNTTVKLVGNRKYYAIPIIFKITNDQGGPVKGFSTFDFAINYENNQSKGFWTGDSSDQTPYTKVYSADAQYLKVIVYKEVSTPNQGKDYGYLKFRLLTIPSDNYTESNSGNVRFGFYQLDLRAVRSLRQSRMMITDKSAVSEETTVSSNNVAETTTESTAETIASSEEVQTTTETTTSRSSEETTSDPSTTSTTTDDTTETTTSSEETVASQ